MALSIPALRCGGPALLPHTQVLRSGPFTLLLEEGQLRRIRLGDREVVRRIYLSVRGPDWATPPAELSDLKVDAKADHFAASYLLTFKKGEIDFTWAVSITGGPEGNIRVEARGKANSAFATNRVGICVLHPLRECSGMPALVRGMDDEAKEGRFPDLINPQQPFLGFKEIAHVVEKEWLGLVRFEGETFEMEDQRNWTDGSFKTYCPPQSDPKPRRLEAGWETLQTATLMLLNPESKPVEELIAALPPAISVPVLRPETDLGRPIPGFGFGLASHGGPLDARDAARLKALSPFHLRADFRLAQAGVQAELERAAAQAQALAIPLEIALVVPEDGEAALAEFAQAWEATGAEAVRWLVFSETQDATSDETMRMARTHLAPFDPLAAFARGSKGDFVLLNRNRPAPQPGISLAYAMSPQVHLTDNRTLVESLEGQAWTLRTVAATWPRSNAIATPITLKRSPLAMALKRPPAAAGPAAPDWKGQADTRQFSLFGAGWTLGSLKRMALNGANSATYYETTGLLGVMAGHGAPEEALRSPAFDFAIAPGWVYPMYHVFADFAGFVGGNAYEVKSELPLRFDAVLLHAGNKATLLLANLEETAGVLRLKDLGAVAGLRRLHEANVMGAMEDPEGYRAAPFEAFPGDEDGWELALRPFEYVRLDLAAE